MFSKNVARAFYHEDGIAKSWKIAARYAGQNGRIATLPDIIDARLETEPECAAWSRYYTTSSAEYFGLTRGGTRILIIAHGVGPMSTLNGVLDAYRYQFNDPHRNNTGGRISQKDFWDLEAGEYGPVSIVDFEAYVRLRAYPFIQTLHSNQAIEDPLVQARIGSRAEEYVIKHTAISKAWHREQLDIPIDTRYQTPEQIRSAQEKDVSNLMYAKYFSPSILTIQDAPNCSYGSRGKSGFDSWLEGRNPPFAHLLSIGQLGHSLLDGKEGLTCTISCHEWNNGTRFVSIPNKEAISTIEID